MKIFVTGGCGYVGSVLVPKLLAGGHSVRVMDCQWFGNYLKPHRSLEIEKDDIRNGNFNLGGTDVVIHLAAVSNDPTGDLDPKLTWEVNALSTMQLADAASRHGVRQFIYASSGSVYGLSDIPQVIEEVPLMPLSDYNRTKMVAERAVLSYADQMFVQVLRPATVCGFSPRMRLDVVVNMLTIQALNHGSVRVLGGTQMRPNIHIEDMTDLYLFMLQRSHLTGIYNAGFENRSVMEIARLIADRTGCAIETFPSNDPRSYRQNSDKLLSAGFRPKHNVSDAIGEIIAAYAAGLLKDEDRWYNLRTMPQAA